MTDRVVLPQRPTPPDPPAFPLLGVLAPLGLALVLFVALQTATVLLLAVFSPVLAVASVVDSRLQLRRRARRDAARHEQALDEAERRLAVLTAARAAEAHRAVAVPAVLAADPGAWAGRPPTGRLCLGTADLPAPPIASGDADGDRERALLAAGARIAGGPLTVDAAATVAVSGPPPLAAAFDRAVAVARLRGGGGDEGATVLERGAGATADLVVAIAPDGHARVVHASGPAADCPVRDFRPALLTRAAHAVAVGGRGATGIEALLAAEEQRGLAARFLVDGDGPVVLDLVADGPHAAIGGTTGSGKSALLTAWLLALAAAHPPERLVLLLVDCKGGAAFDPLSTLPHVAGIVTDLDGAETVRAVESLAAELRRRERSLRAAGVADAGDADLPRLVVVVDEYRALVERSPALAALFEDVAARGRSLGVHLVLCAQRPATAIRDEVLANCGIRIGLRMQDAADSRALVGSDAAARLGRAPVGGAVLAVERVRPVRVAEVDPAAVRRAVAAIRARHPAAAVDRPWLPPLPVRVALPVAPAPLVALGLLDLPDEQRQPVLAWDARRRPRLLVVGDPGSGRTTALHAVAHGLGAAVLPDSAAALWDAVGDRSAPLLVDDLDHLLDRFDAAGAQRVAELLAERLRAPGAAPTVLALRGPSAWSGLPLRPLLGLVDERLQLRVGLDDHLALGGRREDWSAAPPPGRARYDGRTAQVGLPPHRAPVASAPQPDPLPSGDLLLVTSRPEHRRRQLAAAGVAVGGPDDAAGALVGSPGDWQTRWQALERLRRERAVVIDGCGPADLRTLLGVSEALPPIDGPDDAVLLPREGAPRRVRLPVDAA